MFESVSQQLKGCPKFKAVDYLWQRSQPSYPDTTAAMLEPSSEDDELEQEGPLADNFGM